jgi:signal transduction histidine kinase
MTQSTALMVSLFMIVISYQMVRKGSRPARFFLMAWGVFLLSIIAFILKDFGILPYNTITKHILQIGSAVEVILLSLALADKINILKKEKQESQARELEALQEKEKMVREQNIILESKVNDRTRDLVLTNEDLNKAMTELKDAQSQLVNAEKMASLGLLTAGIAHEINNPINFVVANINPLKRDVQDLLEIIDQIADLKDNDDLPSKIKAIKAHMVDIDVDYTIQEIQTLLKRL